MKFTFILVEPAVPENVGATARAIKTMGFKNLALVNPCEYLNGPARWLAHASEEILENALTFPTLHDAVRKFDFIVGTSAKRRSVKHDYLSVSKLPELLKSKGNSVRKVAIVFGREESGLRNEELKLCDLVTAVPMKTVFPSLNLAQAVMLYAWELSKIAGKSSSRKPPGKDESFHSLVQKVRLVLTETGFKEQSAIFPRFLERIAFLDEGDIRLFHSFCNKFLENRK